MEQIRLISIDYLKKNYSGYIEPSIDDSILSNFIWIAQNENILELLRWDLLEKIKTDLKNDELSGRYLELWQNYLKPALALWTVWHAYPFIWTRANNRSVVQKNSETSDNVDLKTIGFLSDHIRARAERAGSLAVEFIVNFPQDFPEYYNSERLKSKGKYNSTIYIEKSFDRDIDPFYNYKNRDRY